MNHSSKDGEEFKDNGSLETFAKPRGLIQRPETGYCLPPVWRKPPRAAIKLIISRKRATTCYNGERAKEYTRTCDTLERTLENTPEFVSLSASWRKFSSVAYFDERARDRRKKIRKSRTEGQRNGWNCFLAGPAASVFPRVAVRRSPASKVRSLLNYFSICRASFSNINYAIRPSRCWKFSRQKETA